MPHCRFFRIARSCLTAPNVAPQLTGPAVRVLLAIGDLERRRLSTDKDAVAALGALTESSARHGLDRLRALGLVTRSRRCSREPYVHALAGPATLREVGWAAVPSCALRLPDGALRVLAACVALAPGRLWAREATLQVDRGAVAAALGLTTRSVDQGLAEAVRQGVLTKVAAGVYRSADAPIGLSLLSGEASDHPSGEASGHPSRARVSVQRTSDEKQQQTLAAAQPLEEAEAMETEDRPLFPSLRELSEEDEAQPGATGFHPRARERMEADGWDCARLEAMSDLERERFCALWLTAKAQARRNPRAYHRRMLADPNRWPSPVESARWRRLNSDPPEPPPGPAASGASARMVAWVCSQEGCRQAHNAGLWLLLPADRAPGPCKCGAPMRRVRGADENLEDAS